MPSLKENEEQSDGKDENEVEEGSAIGRRESEGYQESLLSLPHIDESSVGTNSNSNTNNIDGNDNKKKEDNVFYDNYENGVTTPFVE